MGCGITTAYFYAGIKGESMTCRNVSEAEIKAFEQLQGLKNRTRYICFIGRKSEIVSGL